MTLHKKKSDYSNLNLQDFFQYIYTSASLREKKGQNAYINASHQ